MSYTMPSGGYPVPEQPGANQARPGTVGFATVLLYLMALLSLISAALAVYSAGLLTKEKIVEIYVDAGLDREASDAAASFAAIGSYIGAAFGVLMALLYIILAVFVGKGKQWARITAWVFGGLAICCGAFGVLGAAAGSALSGMGGNQAGFDQKQATEAVADLQPAWLTGASLGLSVISLLAALGVVILLALPPSHPFFRKAEPVWTPPTYPTP